MARLQDHYPTNAMTGDTHLTSVGTIGTAFPFVCLLVVHNGERSTRMLTPRCNNAKYVLIVGPIPGPCPNRLGSGSPNWVRMTQTTLAGAVRALAGRLLDQDVANTMTGNTRLPRPQSICTTLTTVCLFSVHFWYILTCA